MTGVCKTVFLGRKEGFWALQKGNNTMIKKMINLMHYPFLIFQYCVFFIIGKIGKKDKNLWLLSERKYDARDNAWHFFRFLREKHPEINCAFVIDKTSPDFQKVQAIGRCIQPNTIEHYLAFARSEAKISTHIMGNAPDTYRYTMIDRYLNLIKGKKIMLQHGINGNAPIALHYPRARLDLLVCSTVSEYEMIRKEFGHPEGVAQLIGLCRFDKLLLPHEIKRQILIMPTWRIFLRDISNESFMESDYYKCFNGLLTNDAFLSLLEKYDLKAVFYIHIELQSYSSLFNSVSERVEIKTLGEADVQELLMESQLLITDYSSVFFDFAYMDKPVLYWEFDEDVFYSKQYKRGQFDARYDGFGPVIGTKEVKPILDFIEEEEKNNMQVLPMYKERIDRCFSDRHNNNCERTFEAIKGLF